MTGQLDTLCWQFDLIWKLGRYHLPYLTDEICLWEPEAGSWTVRQHGDGIWRADWADKEPDPVPPVTIAWLTWHIIWWWSGLCAAAAGHARVARKDVVWPGTAAAAVARIETIVTEWRGTLSRLRDDELERPLAYPWPQPRPLRIAVAWANAELMKNIAEIGYARHVFEIRRRAGARSG